MAVGQLLALDHAKGLDPALDADRRLAQLGELLELPLHLEARLDNGRAVCRFPIALTLEGGKEQMALPLDAHRHVDVEVQEPARLDASVGRLDHGAGSDESGLTPRHDQPRDVLVARGERESDAAIFPQAVAAPTGLPLV
eukprot:scaffold119530_cov60-Phaeocystis_antarctica.AAC.1